ncbi:MAG TPA: hypothetical protein VGF90_05505 [Verrucomicrobiae bacterium]|jgi:hypothetical protein
MILGTITIALVAIWIGSIVGASVLFATRNVPRLQALGPLVGAVLTILIIWSLL